MRSIKPLFLTALFAAVVIGALTWYSSSRQSAAPRSESPTATVPAGETGRLMPPAESGVTLYTDAERGFLLYHPSDLTPLTDRQEMATLGYIPVCDPGTAVACFPYGQEKYAGTNFESAGLAVQLVSAATEKDCLKPIGGEQVGGLIQLGDAIFQKFVFSEGAAGHRTEGDDYRAFRDGQCYQLTTRINTTVFENWEPGSIKKFTDADQTSVQAVLDKMLDSFRFQGNLEAL